MDCRLQFPECSAEKIKSVEQRMMGSVFRERLDKAPPIPTHSTPTRRSLSVVVVLLNIGSLKLLREGRRA